MNQAPDAGRNVILVDLPGSRMPEHAGLIELAGFEPRVAQGVGGVFEAIHVRTPSCIVVPYIDAPEAAAQLVQEIKSDHVYGHLPVILLLREDQVGQMAWDVVHGDDFVVLPRAADGVASRLRLCIERSARDLDANPLTGLPGNLTIMREAERRIMAGKAFAMGHIDIDNFKPFNDKYGFSRGDEVLRMTARVCVNAVRGLNHAETYVGHVGGDDFILMVPPPLSEEACKAILRGFDQVVPNFYDEEDRGAGKILSVDRQGVQKTFPLMGCSIAVVDTSASNIRHIGELSARAAEIKKVAKAIEGSSYLVDRRK